MLKELVGMMKWKSTMKKCKDMQPYTDEWWKTMTEALEMLPEDQRQAIMDNIVMMGVSL